MNIKIVCKKRLHKLPSSVSTIEQIRAYVINIYKDKIHPNFGLLVQTDPITQALQEIKTDDQLLIAHQIYKTNNWPSIKILVRDSDEDINQQDLDMLNQSMVNTRSMTKQQQQQQESDVTLQFQTQTEVTEQKDVEISNHPDLSNQFQQTKEVEIETKETQITVTTNDKGQDAAYILPMFPDINISGLDIAQTQEYLIRLIDSRLYHYGLIQAPKFQEQKQIEQPQFQEQLQLQQQPQLQEKPQMKEIEQPQKVETKQVPEMFLDGMSQVKFDVVLGQSFEWTIHVVNKGKQQWPQYVQLICTEGQFLGETYNMQMLQPNEKQQMVIQFKPKSACKNQLQSFKLSYVDSEKLIQFGQKISFTLTVKEEDESVIINQSITSQNTDKTKLVQIKNEVASKAKQLKDIFPQLQLKQLIEFINSTGAALTIDELIESLCNQQ